MPMLTRTRRAPPRLGVQFAIFVSAFVSLVLLLLVMEELGTSTRDVARWMLLAPICAYGIIGLMSLAAGESEFFAAGRNVPAFFLGLSTTASTLGSLGVVTLAGLFFFSGLAALPIMTGIVVGLLVAAVLIAPYVRKDGSHTIAGFLGRRFGSGGLRVAACMMATVPALFLLVAELKLGITLAVHTTGVSGPAAAGLAVLAIAVVVVAGGLRGQIYASAAQGLVATIAVVVPIAIVGVMLTNLPFPQLSFGILADDLRGLEAGSGLSSRPGVGLGGALPGAGLGAIAQPFALEFRGSDVTTYALVALMVAMGIASQPGLVQRFGSSLGVFEVRKGMAWSIVVAVFLLLALPAIALFARYQVFSELLGRPVDQVPVWLDRLAGMGLAAYDANVPTITIESLRFDRDAVPVLLATAAGFTPLVGEFVVTGVLALMLAAASSQVMALAALWTEDLMFAWGAPGVLAERRVAIARGAAVGAALLGGWLALVVSADPLRLFLWGLSLSASGLFPILAMAVWWKHINQWGALAGGTVGFLLALVVIVFTMGGVLPDLLGLDGALIALIAAPLGAVVALAVSLLTPQTEKRGLELLRDIRVPGGETIYDREARAARLGKSALS